MHSTVEEFFFMYVQLMCAFLALGAVFKFMDRRYVSRSYVNNHVITALTFHQKHVFRSGVKALTHSN